MTGKNYFILHLDTFGVAVESLNDAELGELIRAIFYYNKGEEFNVSSPVVKVMLVLFKHLADLDNAKYQKACERKKEAMLKRWANNSPSLSPPQEEKPVPKPKPISICHAEYEWVEPQYHDAWKEWCEFKRANKKSYKTEHSLKIAYEQWKKKAGYDPVVASEIVTQSIANNYDGLFELKNNGNNGLTKYERNKLSQQQVATALARQCADEFAIENEGESDPYVIQL